MEDPEPRQTQGESTLERRLSRIAALAGVGACAGFLAVTPNHHVPRAALLAAVAVYALTKLVSLALRLRNRSPLWLAVLCEVAALGVVGFIVWSGTPGPISLALVVFLLLTGGLWRRRLAQSGSEAP